MPPKSKKLKIETDVTPVDVIESLSEDEDSSPDEDDPPSELEDSPSDDLSEEEVEEPDSESDQAVESEDSVKEEETSEEESSVPKSTILDLFAKRNGKIVSMNYCTKNQYKGPIENIQNMINGSVIKEIEIKDEAPVKNKTFFKGVNRKWGWKEEVMLLEGIEINGLFNWELIAGQLSANEKKFKAEEVKNHYYQYYYNGTLGQVWNYRLDEKPIEHFDHTDPIVVCSTNKYLPPVAAKNLREIKFLPHREDFEEFPTSQLEMMVTKVDFSEYYMNNLKALKIDQEVRNLQLLIVDRYRQVVADRMKMYQLMKDFKLIEQFFNMDYKITKKCEIEKHFSGLQKFVGYFDSPNEFIKFYFDCVKEKLLKLEIARLYQVLATKRKKERDPEMKVMLKKRAPVCFSMLTKILYCTSLKSERKNSSSQGEKEHDNILIKAHPTLLEGLRIRCARME